MKNFFVLLNGAVVASCMHYHKAMALFDSFKSKVNVDGDLLQVYQRGFGIIEEY